MSLTYFLLVQVSCFSAGASVVALYVLITRRPPRWWAYTMSAVSRVGIVVTLLTRIIPLYDLEASPITTLYALLVLAGAIGTAGIAYDVVKRYSRSNKDQMGDLSRRIGVSSERHTSMEHRMDVEEQRNTDIEAQADRDRGSREKP